jgi:ribonucleoside-diphosphate reductase beta chain|tara:strand:+ start:8346 stop:9476 length:1131 start_codon:yes stop_codon:yes gene_type:complete
VTYSVFDETNTKSQYDNKLFLDDGVTIARYDKLKYKAFDKLTEKQLGFFWLPQEVDIQRDSKDFRDLTEHEQHIFTSNLKRQILLDSVQGRSPNVALLPIVSSPELETWIETWSFSETIHSRSYTHIIRNVFPDPSVVFDSILDIKEITDCAKDISKYYDDLIEYSSWYNLLGEGTHKVNNEKLVIDKYELKRKIWKAINSVNALEGIRFYVSFACSWAFAELKKMEGNAKIIKFIARDENLHLASTQQLIKLLPKDDPDFAKIRDEMEGEIADMFVEAVEQEKEWAEYLFRDGSMIGLNAQLLQEYIEWIANKRMAAVSIKSPYKVPQSNPLPWTQKWISGGDVQVAPQEVEVSSYVTGGVKKDVDGNTFKGFSL